MSFNTFEGYLLYWQSLYNNVIIASIRTPLMTYVKQKPEFRINSQKFLLYVLNNKHDQQNKITTLSTANKWEIKQKKSTKHKDNTQQQTCI